MDKENRTKFVEYAKCWSPKEKLKDIGMCLDRQIVQLEYISKYVTPDWQIAAICCTHHQKRNCIKSELEKLCGKESESIKYYSDTVNYALRNVLEFSCGPYQSTQICDHRFNSTLWEPIKNLINPNNNISFGLRHKFHSALPPTVSVITHFDV